MVRVKQRKNNDTKVTGTSTYHIGPSVLAAGVAVGVLSGHVDTFEAKVEWRVQTPAVTAAENGTACASVGNASSMKLLQGTDREIDNEACCFGVGDWHHHIVRGRAVAEFCGQ